jgi:Divergent InlB B-repeat domain
VDGDVEVSATFRNAVPDPGSPTLNVIPEAGARVVSVPAGIDCPELCSAQFASGTRVTLKGGAAEWSGECVGSGADCVLVVNETMGVIARGSSPGRRTFGVNVSVSGPGVVSGGVRIASKQIRCGIATGSLFDCGELFDAGTTVRLKAVPRRGAHFARWRGFCDGKKRRCRLRVTAAKTVLAYFRR